MRMMRTPLGSGVFSISMLGYASCVQCLNVHDNGFRASIRQNVDIHHYVVVFWLVCSMAKTRLASLMALGFGFGSQRKHELAACIYIPPTSCSTLVCSSCNVKSAEWDAREPSHD